MTNKERTGKYCKYLNEPISRKENDYVKTISRIKYGGICEKERDKEKVNKIPKKREVSCCHAISDWMLDIELQSVKTRFP